MDTGIRDYLNKNINIYYEEDNNALLLGDSFELLKKIKPKSIDCIFADPPYFLSNGGISVHGGKQVLVNKVG